MNVNKLLYETAKAKIGTWEWAQGDNPVIVKMFADAGFPEVVTDSTPWCAAFVGAVLAECGLMPSGSLAARSYLSWGVPVAIKDAERGDLAVFWRGKKEGWQGHVGFVDSIEGNYVNVLGGNQSDKVSIARYPKTQLLGIRRAVRPRETPKESKTLQATIAAMLTAIATATTSLTDSADWKTLLAVMILLVLLGVIFSERIKAWTKGWR